MTCFGNPVADNLLELFIRHPSVTGRNHFQQASLSRCQEGLGISFEHRLERLLSLPFRVLRGQRLNPIQCKNQLRVQRLLNPESAVMP